KKRLSAEGAEGHRGRRGIVGAQFLRRVHRVTSAPSALSLAVATRVTRRGKVTATDLKLRMNKQVQAIIDALERQGITADIVRTKPQAEENVAKIRLRFDRVALRFVGDLQA